LSDYYVVAVNKESINLMINMKLSDTLEQLDFQIRFLSGLVTGCRGLNSLPL